MSFRKLSIFTLGLLILAGALLLTISLYLGAEQTLEMLRQKLFGEADITRFRAILTPAKFRIIQACIAMALVVLFLFQREIRRPGNRINGFLGEIGLQFKKTIQVLRIPSHALLLFFPLASAIFYAVTLPVSYDEAITYLSFTAKNILVSYTYYPFPNNHVLHTMATSLTKYLPFSMLFNLRISSVFFQMAAWVLAIRFTTEIFGRKTAMLVVGISAMLFLNIYYSYMSRGYALVNLAFIASLYCVYKIRQGGTNPWKWHFLTLFTSLGFWTMPSFLYPFLSLHLVLLASLGRLSLPHFLSGVFTILATVLFYTPIVIVNGLDALINNPYVAPVSRLEVWHSLPLFIKQSITEISGFHWMIVAPLLIIGAVHLLIFGNRERSIEYILWIGSVPVFLLLHSVMAFPRTFIYYGFLLSFLTLGGFHRYFENISLRAWTILCLFLQIFLLWHFHSSIESYEERDPQINITAARIIPQIIGEDNTYLSSGALLPTNLMFEAKARKMKDPRISFTEDAINADTALSYNYVIVVRYKDSTLNRVPHFSNFYYNIYKK